MKNGHKALVVLSVFFFVMTIMNKREIDRQGRQINQTNQMLITLVEPEPDSATEKTGFEVGKEYCFFFADYNRGLAVVGEFDGEICYNKKPRFIILRNVPQTILDIWEKGEIKYGYRKI